MATALVPPHPSIGVATARAAQFRQELVAVKSTTKEEDCGVCDSWSPFSDSCKPCEDGSVQINGQLVTPKALREVEVLNSRGESKQLLDVVGDDSKSVVVFLRHLG